MADCGIILQPALDAVARWCRKWKVCLSTEKCCYTTFTLDPLEDNGKMQVDLNIEGTPLQFDISQTFLGLKLDSHLSFVEHTDVVCRKMAHRRHALRALAGRSVGASQQVVRTAYVATVRAIPDYCSSIWMNSAAPATRNRMESQQNMCGGIRIKLKHGVKKRGIKAIYNGS